MAKHTVTEFGIEVGFSETVMKGLSRLEKEVMTKAVNMERALNRAFKTNGAKVMEETLGKIVRDTNNASRQMKKALQDAFNIKNAGRASIRGFEAEAKAAANNVAKQFRDAMKFNVPPLPYGRPRRQPGASGGTGGPLGGGGTGRGGSGLSYIQRQDRWMESHNVRTTENGMTAAMARLGLTKELGAFRQGMNDLLNKYRGTGDTRSYERAARQLIYSYKDIIQSHKEQIRQQERARFMNEHLINSTMQLARSFVSVYTAVELFRQAIEAGTRRQGANIATDMVFKNNAPNNPLAGQEARLFAAGFAKQIGQTYTETLTQLTKFTASAGPTMGLQGAQSFYRNSTVYGRLLGLNSDQLKHANIAFQQMAGKGQIYAEELKGQLAEALPGAEQLFAKAIYGEANQKNVAKMMDDMKNGLLKADKVLPLVSKEMERQIEAAGGVAKISAMTSVALGNLQGAIENFFVSLFGGMEKGLKNISNALAALLDQSDMFGEGLGAVIGFIFDSLADLIGLLATIAGNAEGYLYLLKEEFDKLPKPIQEIISKIGELGKEFLELVVILGTVSVAAKLLRSTFSFAMKMSGMKALATLGRGAAVEAGVLGGGAAASAAATGAGGAMAMLPGIGQAAIASYFGGELLGDGLNSMFGKNDWFQNVRTADWGDFLPALFGVQHGQWRGDQWHEFSPEESRKFNAGNPFGQQITIPPNAFDGVKMPVMRGRLVVDIPQPDGTFKSQTVDLVGDQFESTFMNNDTLGGGWQGQQDNAGWWQTSIAGGTK